MLVLATVQLDVATPTSLIPLLVMMVACALKLTLANLVNVLDQTPSYAQLSINATMLVLATVQLDNAAIPTSPTLLLVMMKACALKLTLVNLVNVLDQTPSYAQLSINATMLVLATVQLDNATTRICPTPLLVMMVACALKLTLANLVNVLDQAL
jgi:uncharacterized protein YlaN (UPF0358 family)